MNQPWIYMCSPSQSPHLPPSPSHPSGSSQCTSPEHLSHASNLGRAGLKLKEPVLWPPEAAQQSRGSTRADPGLQAWPADPPCIDWPWAEYNLSSALPQTVHFLFWTLPRAPSPSPWSSAEPLQLERKGAQELISLNGKLAAESGTAPPGVCIIKQELWSMKADFRIYDSRLRDLGGAWK